MENGLHEIYVNAEADDGSGTAELMKLLNSPELPDSARFPRICAAIYGVKKGKESGSMCTLVEEYAEARAEEAREEVRRELEEVRKEAEIERLEREKAEETARLARREAEIERVEREKTEEAARLAREEAEIERVEREKTEETARFAREEVARKMLRDGIPPEKVREYMKILSFKVSREEFDI